MKETHYFSHDSNARNDPKCSALISECGMDGYGTYWAIIEILSEQDNYRLEKFPKLFEAIAKQCSSNAEATRSRIEALINDYKLLREDEKFIWSDSLLRRMEKKENKRQLKVEAGRQGGIKSGIARNQGKKIEAPLKASRSTVEANEPKESKVKESKVYILYGDFVKLTAEEHKKLCDKFGKKETDSKIEDMNNWLPQGSNSKKMTDHYRGLLNWLKKDEQKPQQDDTGVLEWLKDKVVR